ncbi:sce7726 family protein [Aliarcobacter cryaerophilus]|uniref:sce7726 family protein n=1 Tax=Aliarcobacter cryaerophilus TaxID=28198 RepID=UPI001B757630|nr:sce7726 family protein [Aliarcobacter cryaerophilus]MBP9876635.1 sce7726 family protein [Leptotrichiaceae bacterium]MCT7514639.1 sce7726 family protein [Aliarcobacter cryaerophilus]
MQFNITNKSIIDLSKIFSPTILKELCSTGNSKKLRKILDELNLLYQVDLKKNLESFFNDVYKILLKNYRNEYIYRSIIIKKILLGIHSLNTAHLINECRVGNSKADCVILNGTSTVYEIKTQFDTFSRLHSQLDDYKKAFEYVYIVVPIETLKKLEGYNLDENIGIMVLNKNSTISKTRLAKSNKNYFNKETIFDILRKNEYIEIISKYYEIPSIPNTKIYTYCKRLFTELDIELIHAELVQILKKRDVSDLQKKVILNVPDSLKALSMQTKLTDKEKNNLLELLQKDMKYII